MTLPPQQPQQPPPPLPAQGTPAAQFPPPPPPRRLSPGLIILLLVGIPLVVLGLIVAGSVAAVNAFRGTPVSDSADADAASSVFIDTPNASIRLSVSDDNQVHATMRGSSSGREPTLDVRTSGNVTEIRGGCPGGFFLFNRCQVRIDVALPADVDVTAAGRNGAITADDLTGNLDLSTMNGSIEVDGSSGSLVLDSTNGKIEVEDSASTEVQARTTNGVVRLSFTEPPDEVTANSSNGGIRIEVPDDGTEYYVRADTTNGRVDTEDVPGDRRADRTITAETTNGGITIETSPQG
ncbi:DUF4097 family beta strand repeat-containing protein [Mycetocola sp.]|uniref:DUF4097 family beta strand repeat-containing protein n=1 Tax=Mycetocola sp. TaxID=1871042 RepID=UPI00261F5473|nr:DUF4097 family beta strand repeat-containing protein [Mycetocola sp.]MCU1560558.1 putative adhesin [Mycetocola sp.]